MAAMIEKGWWKAKKTEVAGNSPIAPLASAGGNPITVETSAMTQALPAAQGPDGAAPVAAKTGKVAGGGGLRLLKRVLAGVVVATVLMGGSVYGWHYWQWASVHETTDDAFIDAHISQISPRVAGYVAKVYVTDNQMVHAGDVLVELDGANYQAALAAAQAKLAGARADLASAKSAVEQARAQVSTAESGVEQYAAQQVSRQAEAEKAAGDLKQYALAKQTGVVSELEWTKIETGARTANAALEASKKTVAAVTAMVEQAKAGVITAESKVAVAEAGIQSAEAGVQSAELNLSYTKIVAMEDGRVTKKNVELGNFVSPGTALMALVSPEVWVTANFKETQLAHMKPGQPVEISVDSYPGVKFAGHVESLQQGSGARFSLLPPENATGNYVKVVQRVPVKIVFDGVGEEGRLLGPGMSVEPAVKVE